MRPLRLPILSMIAILLAAALAAWTGSKPHRTDLLYVRVPTGQYLVVQLYPCGVALGASTLRPPVFPADTYRDPNRIASRPHGWAWGHSFFNVSANGPAPWPWEAHSRWNDAGFWHWRVN